MTAINQTRMTIALHAAGAASDWIMLLPIPKGGAPITTRDGRGPYSVANAAQLIADSMRDGKIAIDVNHSIDIAGPQGLPSPAVGWVDQMQQRADGIWGHVEWSDEGKAVMHNRAYRSISPVFAHKPDGSVVEILRASLTNTPNLRTIAALHATGGNMDDLTQLRTKLGLPDTADIAAVLAKIDELLTTKQSAGGVPDPSEFVPIAQFEGVVARMNQLNQGIELESAKQHVETVIRAGRMVPALRDWGVSLCTVNKPRFDDFVRRTSGSLQMLFKEHAVGSPPSAARADSLDDDEIRVALNLGIDPKAFAATRATRSD